MLPASHLWSLSAIAVLSGVGMFWALRRFSDQAAIERAKRQIRANLYAFRLFGDEPRLIFRAQGRLLAWNARYLALMARPAAVMLLPGLILVTVLDQMYGHRALRAGETATVTAQFGGAADASLEGRGVTVETPGVRIPSQRQICWRVRALGDPAGAVVLRIGDAAASKTVQSGTPGGLVPERRVRGVPAWLRYPGEAPLPPGSLSWVEVAYPAARLDVLGWELHWLVWFLIVNVLTVAAAGKFWGVAW